jgi:hypothetical protein
MADIRATSAVGNRDRAFIGYKSKMRSCRVIRLGNDRLRCETSWKFRFLGIILGLAFGLFAPLQIVRETYVSSSGNLPFPALVMAIVTAGLGWFAFVQCFLFTRAIEIDANAGSIELVRHGWRKSRELLPISRISDVIVEKAVRLKDGTGADNQWNRIDCWMLRALLKDGRSRILCETTDRAIVEEMRSFICGIAVVELDTLPSSGH